MPDRPLFTNKTSPHLWLWRGATLLAGIGVLAVVAAKIHTSANTASTHQQDNLIAQQSETSHTLPLTVATESTAQKPTTSTATTSTATTPQSVTQLAKLDGPKPPAPSAQTTETPGPAKAIPANLVTTPTKPAFKLRQVTVKSGDSLSTLFERAGLGYSDVHRVMTLGDSVSTLKTLHPGEQITFKLSPDGKDFQGLSYELTPSTTLNVHLDGNDQLVASEKVVPLDTKLRQVSGTIDSSLYQSAIDVGAPPAKVMKLAEIFGWKINFLTDVREGDRFTLIYEEKYKDGKPIETGHIVAAEFTTNSGKTYQALRYTTPDGSTGYYEPDGKNLDRGFLRYPVRFSRISSKFNLHRMHPIYHRIKAHKGVDFAAPTGTPIHASGGGTIKFIGWQHGYGKVIKIKHDSRYESVYGHMSRFNKSLRRGSHVDKGDVIGYVGMTGAATGPHLHYEFHVNGKYRDPLKVALPEAHPIPSKYRTDFLTQTQPLVDRLTAVDHAQVQQTASLSQSE